jgi:hypothetical protein
MVQAYVAMAIRRRFEERRSVGLKGLDGSRTLYASVAEPAT